jgi:hypothetical protein
VANRTSRKNIYIGNGKMDRREGRKR